MARNAPFGIAGIVLVAASLVLIFLLILPGVADTAPLNRTYFLRADTSDITGARSVTQWTYFYFCGRGNKDCGGAHPASPFGQAWDRDARGVPDSLIGSHGGGTTSTKMFYLWRFGWVFFLIALFFQTLAFFSGFLACCGRLGAAVAGLMATVALFFLSVANSLMTATFVIARNAFTNDRRPASIGQYAFGFAWGAWAALFIATVLFCLGLRQDKAATPSTGGGFSRRPWRRRRSVRSSTYDGRRVKDDYS